ncbi:MAG: hypothetical protein LC123_05135 [Burkholderiales bacterium]|jgi:hypothetical protein|nr:hypothetical protein [Zoogloeaceae bacterium]MBP9655193.1 hypothetical protein [Rhodocyclaceae bacterium]MCZ2172933.1 hypothetical protein [Burkholderiales bacterium]OQY74467.1 MAG: hypothetical protein B6D47_02555 [Rhodocyclaceae bacterium UTPRO2]HNQ57098.1 hypothetical protein [Candidatus Desulfobacillus denitrificans]
MRSSLTLTLLAATWLTSLSAASLAQNAEERPVEESPPNVKTVEPPKPLTKQEQAEARRLARAERARELAKERADRERLCVIKPVMTDAEIAFCKDVWR